MFKRFFLNAKNSFNFAKTETLNGMPDFANLIVSKAKTVSPDIASGCGIYFILHHNKLVYIGKFQGTKSNPFAGDIFSARWNRHVSTLSLRGKSISIGSSLIKRFSDELSHHPLNGQLLATDPAMLAHDRGFMVSYNRLKFAALKWDSFIATDADWLSELDFGYVQLNSAKWEPPHSPEKIRSMISRAEEELIKHYTPICNAGSPFDERLIREIPIDHLFGSIENALMGDLSASQQEDLVSVVSQTQTQPLPEEIQSPAYAEQLLENLPGGCPEDTLIAIYNAFGSNSNVQIHSTKTHGGDIRIRALNIAQPRNIFTMYWQTNHNVFKCRILLALNQVTGDGVVEACDSPADEPLPTSFKFDCGLDNSSINHLVNLISNAIEHAS